MLYCSVNVCLLHFSLQSTNKYKTFSHLFYISHSIYRDTKIVGIILDFAIIFYFHFNKFYFLKYSLVIGNNCGKRLKHTFFSIITFSFNLKEKPSSILKTRSEKIF